MIEKMTPNKKFTINGSIDIPDSATPMHSFSGEVVGYELADGRKVRLVMGLEIESEDGSSHKDVTSESDICDLGFNCLDYGCVTFE